MTVQRKEYIEFDLEVPIVTVAITPEVVSDILGCDNNLAKDFIQEVYLDLVDKLDNAIYDLLGEMEEELRGE